MREGVPRRGIVQRGAGTMPAPLLTSRPARGRVEVGRDNPADS